MGAIHVFNHISIDGFFAGPNGEIDWFYAVPHDDEWYKYTHSQAGTSNTLIFGRITYEMMKSFWPTEEAIKTDQGMANAVNNSPKIVFSKTLKSAEEGSNLPDGKAGWKNIKLLNEIKKDEIQKLKKENDITILGSGSIIQQFTNLDLIDEYFLVIVPLILGTGKSLFGNVNKKNLKLINAKSFKNGIVLMHYKANRQEK
ncbi:MAG TPA: dihydrofolate reductase family protein [Ignavibacteriaceae bacterium]|nr:dihydrofolate reductase family protein [Ignavibacteriaceae bacterium]